MKSLRIPQVLVVATLTGATFSCAPRPSPSDAQSDGAQGDVAQSETGSGEAGACEMRDASSTPPFNMTLCGRDNDGGVQSCGAPCDNGTCSGGCRLCVANQFEGEIGIACRPRGGSMANCPSRVCQPSDCPAGCETCESPLFCIPDQTMADGAMPNCVGTTCDPMNGCPAGCRAVG
ncbi:MAG: hypothetical protein U0269_24140 [Polyangiales bacterium]